MRRNGSVPSLTDSVTATTALTSSDRAGRLRRGRQPVEGSTRPLRQLAADHGLTRGGARPTLWGYLRQLWERRQFIGEFARAHRDAQYAEARLGSLWQVVTPLLNAAIYYLIFGRLMGTRHGIPDFVPYLVIGVFVFTFTQSSAVSGVRAVSGNLGLIRALQFPRAALPIALTLVQLRQLMWSLIVVIAVVAGTGSLAIERWPLIVPALVLQSLFNAGLALVFARLGSQAPDLAELMPFLMRTWLYASGVMYSLSDKAQNAPHIIRMALELNPAAIYIDLIRHSLIDSVTATWLPPHAWSLAVAWAAVLTIGGFGYFWQAEERYGRG
jgi:teichoic acid transport system permease protein